MRKYKIQAKIFNDKCYFSEESLDLVFPHSSKFYMVMVSRREIEAKDSQPEFKRQVFHQRCKMDGFH